MKREMSRNMKKRLVINGCDIPTGLLGCDESVSMSLLIDGIEPMSGKGTKCTNKKRKQNNKRNKKHGKK